MKKRLTSVFLALVLAVGAVVAVPVTAYAAFEGEEWYDQIETVEVNREDAHALFVPYQDAQTALDNEESVLTRDFSRSDYFQTLNGTWKFKAVDKPADRIEGFWQTDAATTSAVEAWDDLAVPSNWVLARNEDGSLKYDKPIYINTRYPWRTGASNFTGSGGSVNLTAPVKAPVDFNPVGHYRRTFELPADWAGRETFLTFDGVESAFYLWINGQKVGYAEDSFTASEFNITKYLQPGTNTIAVQVYRWSTGSYLENQDYFRLAGIFRDVYMISKNKVELRDFFITPDLDENFENATLKMEASVRNYGADAGLYTVEATLKNMDDTDVWAEPLTLPVTVAAAGESPSRATVSGGKAVTAPRLWFADTPNLYKLLIELKDSAGNVVETAVSRVGFREVDRNTVVNANGNQIMSINGKRIMIRGVNRHEFSSVNGRALTREEITTDLVMMKQNNINAIRTSHYPNHPYTYALADEIGIYMCDEANVESHEGAQTSLQNKIPGTTGVNPDLWMNAVLDRTFNMVEQHKNFQSIVIWSLGNEAAYNNLPPLNQTDPVYPHMAQSRWIKERDASRLIKYERDNRSGLVDIRSNQYPGANSARNMANAYSTAQDNAYYNSGVPFDHKLPYIISEYQHSMGNAGGGLNEYWKLFREIPQAQGGFLWDFIDQGVEMPVPEGSVNPDDASAAGKGTYIAYGGDFGELFHDNDFCNNGIVFADRTPKPIMNEVRYTHQEIWYTASEAELAQGIVHVSNEFLNTPLNQFDHTWAIVKDGETVQSGALALATAPLTKEDITIPAVAAIVPEPGAEYFLRLSAALKADTMWAEAGYVVATEQFELPIAVESEEETDMAAMPAFESVTDEAAALTVTGADFSVTFDKTKAEITSIEKDGAELIKSGPVPNHWRSMGSNDRTFNASFETSRWTDATNKVVAVDNDENGKFVTVRVDSTYPNGSANTTVYTLLGNGEIIVENTLSANLSSYLLRIGMKMEMPEGYDTFTYYGQGPGENYSDRQAASEVGLYETATADVYTPYTRPQFYGNRMGVRWFSVTDGAGNGLMIDAKETVNASASNYDEDEFGTGRIVSSLSQDRIRHLYDAPKHAGAIVNIDLGQASIGSWGGWNGEVENASLGYPANGTYTYAYRIIPVTGETNEQKMAESKVDFATQEVEPPEAVQVGDVVWANDVRLVNGQGTGGTNHATTGLGTNSPAFGAITNYDPQTIGLFYEEGVTVAAGTNYINALDNPAGTSAADEQWRGFVEVSVEAGRADMYTLSALGYNSDGARSFEATVNGLAQSVTPTLQEAVAGSANSANPLKVLQADILLQEGMNTIRLQAPQGGNAPNFIAMTVSENTAARANLVTPPEWVGATKTANPNIDLSTIGSSGTIQTSAFVPTISAYDPDTYGWFVPDLNQSPAFAPAGRTTYYANALDDKAAEANWRGSATVKTTVPEDGLYMLYLMAVSDTADRYYEVTVNGASQGQTVSSLTSPIYAAAGGRGVIVIPKPVKLTAGENLIKLQAPSEQNACMFIAMATVGYHPAAAETGDVLMAGGAAVEARNGQAGGLTVDVADYGTLQNYDAGTIGQFLDLANGAEITYSRLNGIGRTNDYNRGHVNLSVNVPMTGVYTINVLCATGTDGLAYDVSVNGGLQTVTTTASNDTQSAGVYSTNSANAVNVVTASLLLTEGESVITLQGQTGIAAPAFMAAALAPDYGVLSGQVVGDGYATVQVFSEYAGQLIVAGYDEAGRLQDMGTVAIEAGFNTYYTQLTSANFAEYRAFIWSDSFVPYYPAKVIQRVAVS